jgi:ATP synthase protein I
VSSRHWHHYLPRGLLGNPAALKDNPGVFQKMLANIAPTARRSALVTAAAGAVMLAISVTAGVKGVLGAAIAIAVVAGFFGLTVLAFFLGAKVSAQAMAGAGMTMYFVKVLALLILVSSLRDATVFSGLFFGLTVIVLVLVYQAAMIVTWHRTKMLYVEPDGER